MQMGPRVSWRICRMVTLRSLLALVPTCIFVILMASKKTKFLFLICNPDQSKVLLNTFYHEITSRERQANKPDMILTSREWQ